MAPAATMSGQTAMVALAAISILLAGCAGGTGKGADPAPAPASVVVGDDPLAGGSIVGTVINDELAPIEGATAGLQGIEATATSDKSGKFEFQNVPPGEHTLFVARLGYEAAPKKVTVVEGETVEITISLQPISISEPYVDFVPFKLFMACGYGLIGVTVTTAGALCPEQVFGTAKATHDVNASRELESAIGEMRWVQGSAFSAKTMRLDFGKDESGGSTPSFKYRYGSATTVSPVQLRADAPFDGLSDMEEEKAMIRYRIWTPFQSPDPPFVMLVLQQSFDVYSSFFYGDPAPEGYSGLPDA